MKRSSEAGYLNPLLIPLLLSILAVLGLSAFGVWSYMNYSDQKNNVDQIVATKVDAAKKQQSEEDQAKFTEQEKQPTRLLTGPVDLGSVQVAFPKTWSVYIGSDGTGQSSYEAYLYPGAVPPVASNSNSYALRIAITSELYDTVLLGYENGVKKGDLKTTPITVGNTAGIRLDGTFNEKNQGSMVIFKVRDKTLRVYTQSTTFVKDFDNIILKSLKFNP